GPAQAELPLNGETPVLQELGHDLAQDIRLGEFLGTDEYRLTQHGPRHAHEQYGQNKDGESRLHGSSWLWKNSRTNASTGLRITSSQRSCCATRPRSRTTSCCASLRASARSCVTSTM